MAKLKNFRDLVAHFSVRELALALDISTQAAHALKNGSSLPAVHHLPKIAKLLAMPLGDVTATVARESEERRSAR